MNADAFRQYYEYHFSENRKLWEQYILPLTQEQYTQAASYSRGSVRDQLAHLMNVDEDWFRGLRGEELSEPLDPAQLDDRQALRALWDAVEQQMRQYLAALRDDMLFDKPFAEGEDQDLILWQVLLHVVNHGTDHRAQLLRQLNDLGIQTTAQDYVFYVYEHPQASLGKPEAS